MMTTQEELEMLAGLLEYPGGERRTPEFRTARLESEATGYLTEFEQRAAELSLDEMQETYTLTFDLNPVAALEIGYHLFGENYKRGLFLAQLRETEARYGLDDQRQLPDYLPLLLRLLIKLDDAELREDLIAECLLPALGKMKTALRSKENIYASLIEAVETQLKAEAPAYRAGVLARELNVLPGTTEFIG